MANCWFFECLNDGCRGNKSPSFSLWAATDHESAKQTTQDGICCHRFIYLFIFFFFFLIARRAFVCSRFPLIPLDTTSRQKMHKKNCPKQTKKTDSKLRKKMPLAPICLFRATVLFALVQQSGYVTFVCLIAHLSVSSQHAKMSPRRNKITMTPHTVTYSRDLLNSCVRITETIKFD